MHRDKQLGLGLGILLVGVAAAFFFRHEPPAATPELSDAESLDRQIAQRDVAPYPESVAERASGTATASERLPREAAWDLPEFLRDDDGTSSDAPAPNPIPSAADTAENRSPAHNRTWLAPDEVAAREPATSSPLIESGPEGGARGSATDEGVVRHRVVQGDTLSGLAARYLGSSGRFLEIYEANRDVLRSPNDLRVGMTLRIPAPEIERPPQREQARTVRVSETQNRSDDASAGAAALEVAPALGRQVLPPVSTPENRVDSDGQRAERRPRFMPVRRSPLLPGGAGPPTPRADSEATHAGRVLTPKPPVDLLPLEDVFDDDPVHN